MAKTVLFVGRLSGPKNQVLLKMLRESAPRTASLVPGVRFQVVGGPVGEEHLKFESEAGYRIFHGHQPNLAPFYRKADVVVGAGRVALEAMALGKPVVALGERRYVGPLTPKKADLAKATNFGDCHAEEKFDWEALGKDLATLLMNASLRRKVAATGQALLKAEYDMDAVFPRMERLYGEVLLESNLSRFHEIPVLMYHRVVAKAPDFTKFNLHITREDLEEQLLSLKERGFTTVGFEDLLSRRLPEKPVILTFDDGYEDNHRYLMPALRKTGMKAVLYALGNRKHRTNFWDVPKGEPEARLLGDAQLREMAKSGLVEVGAHSLNHVDLRKLGEAGIRKETEGAKRSLEDLLGKPVVSFAYPYGFVDEEVKRLTREAGYTFGIAVNSGPTRFRDDLMEIRRVHIFPRTSPFEYRKKTSGWYLRYRKLMGKD